MCESFNKWIIDARFQPIISMLEAIRCKVMRANRGGMERFVQTSPKVEVLHEPMEQNAIANGQDAYEVKNWDHRFVVNLVAKTCSSSIVVNSSHAIACILFKTSGLMIMLPQTLTTSREPMTR
ncbi:hypothetical protein U9M48_014305 [Paspalum notatum var. saurae]|uniref:Uncharacterized protein n=1 Tax=Paspalum notatum var. saurae TaxID=547442 RepID=A0AAQ3WKM8_PASNO